MGLDRRNFLKTLGVVGATLTVGKGFGASKPEPGGVEFKGLLYDSVRCEGCQSCEYACAEANGLPEPTDTMEIGIRRDTNETRRMALNVFKTGKGDFYTRTSCMHCNEPACVAACLTQAMYKTKEGPVIWREDKCMGCRYCMVSCPYDVPKFEYNSPNPKIHKCTMCYDRIKEGGIPACAEACPAEAIVYGSRRELIKEARRRIAEKPEAYHDHIYGEHEAGGTSFLNLTPVPGEELGLRTKLQNASYPALSKGFLYSVPSVFVLIPPLLLGIREATKDNHLKNEDHE